MKGALGAGEGTVGGIGSTGRRSSSARYPWAKCRGGWQAGTHVGQGPVNGKEGNERRCSSEPVLVGRTQRAHERMRRVCINQRNGGLKEHEGRMEWRRGR